MKKLADIQAKLVVPKNQFNAFGKYNYRSCEDILAAAKPICIERGCVLIVSDKMVTIGDRYYVEAEATLLDSDGGESISVKAYAREEETKKGMDAAQITGSASSYARKYALNGLFAIDDVKDADYNGKHESKPESKPEEENKIPGITKNQLESLKLIAKERGFTPADMKDIMADMFSKAKSMDLTQDEAQKLLDHLQPRITDEELHEAADSIQL